MVRIKRLVTQSESIAIHTESIILTSTSRHATFEKASIDLGMS